MGRDRLRTAVRGASSQLQLTEPKEQRVAQRGLCAQAWKSELESSPGPAILLDLVGSVGRFESFGWLRLWPKGHRPVCQGVTRACFWQNPLKTEINAAANYKPRKQKYSFCSVKRFLGDRKSIRHQKTHCLKPLGIALKRFHVLLFRKVQDK